MTGLHKALKDGRYKQFLLLLDLGSDPNVKGVGGLSPLMKCCDIPTSSTASVLVKALLDNGADRDALDKLGRGVLAHAVLKNQLGVIKILLKDDCDINHSDKYGNTVYHYMAYLGLTEIAELFLPEIKTYGCFINAYNVDGMTPLMCACAAGNLGVAKIFVYKYKASLKLRDRFMFKSALDWLKLVLPIPDEVDPFEMNFIPIGRKNERLVEIPSYITRASTGIDHSHRGRSSYRDTTNVRKPRSRCTSAPAVTNRCNTPIPTIIVESEESKPVSSVISINDYSELKSPQTTVRMMKKRPATSFEIVRQILTDFAPQRSSSYRQPAVATFHDHSDSEAEEDDITVSGRSSQMSNARCRSPFNSPKRAADLLDSIHHTGKNKSFQRKNSKAINLKPSTEPDSPSSSGSDIVKLKGRLKNQTGGKDSGNSLSTVFAGMKFASKLRGRGARHSIAVTSGLPSLGLH
ncbi:uncharacterized protein LOC141901519 [Tubulanus polymorphus]|uniref:uncharacterized protein LOC141901519 n=1 Tax=Tubulanus polymorphus TaxID=672921 RepID=UPI003DA1FDD3